MESIPSGKTIKYKAKISRIREIETNREIRDKI